MVCRKDAVVDVHGTRFFEIENAGVLLDGRPDILRRLFPASVLVVLQAAIVHASTNDWYLAALSSIKLVYQVHDIAVHISIWIEWCSWELVNWRCSRWRLTCRSFALWDLRLDPNPVGFVTTLNDLGLYTGGIVKCACPCQINRRRNDVTSDIIRTQRRELYFFFGRWLYLRVHPLSKDFSSCFEGYVALGFLLLLLVSLCTSCALEGIHSCFLGIIEHCQGFNVLGHR